MHFEALMLCRIRKIIFSDPGKAEKNRSFVYINDNLKCDRTRKGPVDDLLLVSDLPRLYVLGEVGNVIGCGFSKTGRRLVLL